MKARMIMVEAEGEAASAAARTVADFIERGQALQRAVNSVLPAPTAPIDIIASAIADGRGAGSDGRPRIGRQTQRRAQAVLAALDAAGWKVLRK